MTLSILDRYITQTDSGITVPAAVVTIYKESGDLADLFEDKDGVIPADNPVTADVNGRVKVYMETGKYSASAEFDGDVVNYPDIDIGTDLEQIKSNKTNFFNESTVYRGTPTQNSARDSISALAGASFNRRVPRVSPLINEKIQRVMSTDSGGYISSTSAGGSGDGIVFGVYKDVDDNDVLPTICFLSKIGDISASLDFSVTVSALTGSDISNVTVQYGLWKSFDNGSAQVGSRITIPRVGNDFNLTGGSLASTLGDDDDLFGVFIFCSEGDFELTSASITSSSSGTKSLKANDMYNNQIWMTPVSSKNSVRTQFIDSDVELRVAGTKSGHLPSKILASPSAIASSGNTASSVSGTQAAGVYFNNALTPIYAFFSAQVYYKNGFNYVPAVILDSGTYTNYSASAAHLQMRTTAPIDRNIDYVIACPNGVATLTAGTSNSEGVVLAILTSDFYPKFYLANIHCDATITRPFVSVRCNVDAVNIKCENSDNEGIDIDYSDVTIESSEFTGVRNDGINSHASGHTILIDVKSHDNRDDGFSPHDDCTYEVWGGEYYNNGKGNVIPALGARGFCVGVKSYGSTGLSPRAQPAPSIIDGGFVCYDNGQLTSMFLIDCESDGDNNGIVTSGSMSYVSSFNSKALNSTGYDYVSSESDVTVGLGSMTSYFADFTSSSVFDNSELITAYNFTSLEKP